MITACKAKIYTSGYKIINATLYIANLSLSDSSNATVSEESDAACLALRFSKCIGHKTLRAMAMASSNAGDRPCSVNIVRNGLWVLCFIFVIHQDLCCFETLRPLDTLAHRC